MQPSMIRSRDGTRDHTVGYSYHGIWGLQEMSWLGNIRRQVRFSNKYNMKAGDSPSSVSCCIVHSGCFCRSIHNVYRRHFCNWASDGEEFWLMPGLNAPQCSHLIHMYRSQLTRNPSQKFQAWIQFPFLRWTDLMQVHVGDGKAPS